MRFAVILVAALAPACSRAVSPEDASALNPATPAPTPTANPTAAPAPTAAPTASPTASPTANPTTADAACRTDPAALGLHIENHTEERDLRPSCSTSLQYLVVSGAKDEAAQRALNAKLKAAVSVSPKTCGGASAEHAYRFQVTSSVRLTAAPSLLEVYVERYEYLGGAHGLTSGFCSVADVTKGTLTPLGIESLPPVARAALASKVRSALMPRENELFPLGDIPLSSAALCVDPEGLDVDFPAGILSMWMNGGDRVLLSPDDARAFVARTPFAPLLLAR